MQVSKNGRLNNKDNDYSSRDGEKSERSEPATQKPKAIGVAKKADYGRTRKVIPISHFLIFRPQHRSVKLNVFIPFVSIQMSKESLSNSEDEDFSSSDEAKSEQKTQKQKPIDDAKNADHGRRRKVNFDVYFSFIQASNFIYRIKKTNFNVIHQDITRQSAQQ